MEETLKAHKPNLDTTGLENSFDQFGRTIFEVLSAQQRTNQKLEEQFHRANETQEYQAEAMQDMAQANFQMKYDHMFAGVPMYDGTNPDSFDDWLYQIESLCELSRRDVRVELMGRASAQVKRIIRSLPMDIEWEIAQRELKRCLTEEKSRAHSAFKPAQIKQKPNENLRIFILRYQDLHSAATGKTAAEDTDPTHIIRFLGMMTNSEIGRKITQKGIPEGMTLGQAFTQAIELEAGYQLSVLIDTGAMKSCMSQAYYQQLMLPATRTIHSCSIKSANGTNLCPIGITECEFKIGTKEYKNDFIVCKNLV